MSSRAVDGAGETLSLKFCVRDWTGDCPVGSRGAPDPLNAANTLGVAYSGGGAVGGAVAHAGKASRSVWQASVPPG